MHPHNEVTIQIKSLKKGQRNTLYPMPPQISRLHRPQNTPVALLVLRFLHHPQVLLQTPMPPPKHNRLRLPPQKTVQDTILSLPAPPPPPPPLNPPFIPGHPPNHP
ncbi:unnamed protein product [Cuscuta europaea]|uniref:Uncharacterized protein n=1 Tax=Cuscuta europaea TaxID=41803 RepID=A0A9P1EMD8_CUSEU|nr:unnamed protein product [Cuscuta europaea]